MKRWWPSWLWHPHIYGQWQTTRIYHDGAKVEHRYCHWCDRCKSKHTNRWGRVLSAN